MLPEELYHLVWDRIAQQIPKLQYGRVIMSLSDVLSGDFYIEHIKSGKGICEVFHSSVMSPNTTTCVFSLFFFFFFFKEKPYLNVCYAVKKMLLPELMLRVFVLR